MKKVKSMLLVAVIMAFFVAAVAPIQAENKAGKAPAYPDGTLLMSEGGKAIYVMEKGKKVLIPDPETFTAKKYRLDQVKKLEITVLKSIPEGKPLPSVKEVDKKKK